MEDSKVSPGTFYLKGNTRFARQVVFACKTTRIAVNFSKRSDELYYHWTPPTHADVATLVAGLSLWLAASEIPRTPTAFLDWRTGSLVAGHEYKPR